MAAAAVWAWVIASPSHSLGPGLAQFVGTVVGVRFLIYVVLRLYRLPWRTVSSNDVLWLAGASLLGVPPLMALLLTQPEPFGGQAVHLLPMLQVEPALSLVLLAGARIASRTLATNSRQGADARRILVVGSGDGARALVWQMQNAVSGYRVVGLVDDNPQRHGARVLGLPVLGCCRDIPRLVAEMAVHQIVIAIPSLSPERLQEMLLECEPAKVPVRTLPPLRELMHNPVGVGLLREVRAEDLLPRAEVKLDTETVARYARGRTVLVTGGGGSIGGELCRQVLRAGARRLLVLGRGENSVFEVLQELLTMAAGCEVVPVICDVQDRRALRRVFEEHHPELVFHAAAHKHVPLMEQYPAEAVKNNIVGTLNVVRLSAEHRVSSFVLISTDKAVNPTSVMGSTKRVAEQIVKAFAELHDLNMVSVRFGNVLGSRGSVVPVMTRQIRNGGPVTVTDPEMVRYFMTIPEAVQLVLQAGAMGGRGEVFVLDMGHPVRILDLATDLIRRCGLVPHQDVPIHIVGRRPGEKLKEDLLHQMEVAGARKTGPFYVAPTEAVCFEEMLQDLQRLQVAAEAGRHDQVVMLLKDVIPSYLPDAAQQARLGPEPTAAPMRKAS